MTDSQKLDLILSELSSVKTDVSNIKKDISDMKAEMNDMKAEMSDMKAKMSSMEADISDLKDQVYKIQLHLENVTDRNIELLAENHCTLVDKLNQAIPAADKSLSYEIKVNYLLERVSILEQKVEVLEAR